jgi:hypothetical protein
MEEIPGIFEEIDKHCNGLITDTLSNAHDEHEREYLAGLIVELINGVLKTVYAREIISAVSFEAGYRFGLSRPHITKN